MSGIVKQNILKSKQITKASKTKNEKLRVNVRNVHEAQTRRTSSMAALEELVQCGICLERLTQPRMLHCQHTFCLSCLQSHMVARKIALEKQPPSLNKVQIALANLGNHVLCPICNQKTTLENGFDSLESLPKNLYIDSLLKVLECASPEVDLKGVNESKCAKCNIVCELQRRFCQHCLQGFCRVCWSEHMQSLENQIGVFHKQLEESEVRLGHKLDQFVDRCDQLKEAIEKAVEEKINRIISMKEETLQEIHRMKSEGDLSYENLRKNISDTQNELSIEDFQKIEENQKVPIFMNFHKETSQLVDSVYHWGDTKTIFDPDTFKLERDTESIYEEVEEDGINHHNQINQNPLDNPTAMLHYYKTRPFTPKLVWTKCPRPAGLGIPPWDPDHLYVAATDSHNILILDRQKMKLIGKLSSPEMLCPQSVAFHGDRSEVFVGDKWKHCVHVFSSAGEYLRVIGGKGGGDGKFRSPESIALGNNSLIVCDTGNDRIQIVCAVTGEHLKTIGINGKKTEFNTPLGVAVYNEVIIVADSGNHKIKLYNFNGEKLGQFGTFGKLRGQFRSPEVVAVDPMGFLLVGDSGNGRIQVFKMDGTVVRVFGSDDFGWVSGVVLTPDLEVVVTDMKKKKLRVF